MQARDALNNCRGRYCQGSAHERAGCSDGSRTRGRSDGSVGGGGVAISAATAAAAAACRQQPWRRRRAHSHCRAPGRGGCLGRSAGAAHGSRGGGGAPIWTDLAAAAAAGVAAAVAPPTAAVAAAAPLLRPTWPRQRRLPRR